jgi:hypothetical protein
VRSSLVKEYIIARTQYEDSTNDWGCNHSRHAHQCPWQGSGNGQAVQQHH